MPWERDRKLEFIGPFDTENPPAPPRFRMACDCCTNCASSEYLWEDLKCLKFQHFTEWDAVCDDYTPRLRPEPREVQE